MSARRDNADGPEDIDAAFAEIVAGLEQDEQLARWPDEDSSRADSDQSDPVEPQQAANPTGPRDWRPGQSADEDEEGHYEPPEPPPMPRPSAAAIGGIGLILVGVLLLLVPGLAGLGGTVPLTIGLISVSSGIGWLLLRMRRNPPEDDGAQL